MLTKESKVGDVITDEDGNNATLVHYSQFKLDAEYVLVITCPQVPDGCMEVTLVAALIPTTQELDDIDEEDILMLSATATHTYPMRNLLEVLLNAVASKYAAKKATEVMSQHMLHGKPTFH